jgi:hypothetical protein
MLVWISTFAVLVALGGLCPETPLGAGINRAVLDVWSALTSGRSRSWWRGLLAVTAVLIVAALARGTPSIFAIGGVADAAAYIDLAGVLLVASAARLAFVAVRGGAGRCGSHDAARRALQAGPSPSFRPKRPNGCGEVGAPAKRGRRALGLGAQLRLRVSLPQSRSFPRKRMRGNERLSGWMGRVQAAAHDRASATARR